MELNKIYLGNCLDVMETIPDELVHLIVTSPPYYNLRDYSCWPTYQDYLKDVWKWFVCLNRILKPGGHICWNIQENIPEPDETGRHYYPLLPDTVKIGLGRGLEWEKNVVWNKKNGTQILFGSYPYPPTPIFTDLVEYILVFKKDGKLEYTKEQKEASKLSKERWFEITRNVWEIAPAKATQIGHPAPYPLEIPKRFIEVMTCKGSIVYDPFMGSGTTALACKLTGRNYLGSEQKQEYLDLSQRRLDAEVDILA